MALHATINTSKDPANKEHEQSTPNNLIKSKDSNKMETDGAEELGKHLDDLVGNNNDKEEDEAPNEEEISFGPGHLFFCPPSFACTFVASDLRTPDLQNIMWTSIRIPVPSAPANTTDAMFDALDEFLTKMKEADRCFTVFPHNLSQYGSLNNLPRSIEDPDDLPMEVDDWLVYFPQAKPHFNGGNIYTTALISSSIPLGCILKEQGDWFKESKFGLWEATIQTKVPVSVGWLLFSTNNTNTDILKREISAAIEDIPVGLRWKMISLGTQGKISKENQVRALHVYVDKMDAPAAKPHLMELYAGNASIDHAFPLHMWM